MYYAEVLPQDKAAQVKAAKAAGKIVGMVVTGSMMPRRLPWQMSALQLSRLGCRDRSSGYCAYAERSVSVAAAISLSRATPRKIRQNLFFAFIYTVLGILRGDGIAHPVIAGAAMAMSSVSVVTNSLLLKRWKLRNADMAGSLMLDINQ